ncbi:MAG: serine/threonine-protein phosphatase [Rhodobacteraceae bacterium]|nr:serine/threonine-protein phosphatase [Paracoccaceae bacterium]
MYDIAAAASKGRRDYQEDAVAIDFQEHDGPGFVVLADGMGGHEAGDVASRIVVSEFADILKERLYDEPYRDDGIPAILREATMSANASIASYVARNRDVAGMGTTLLAPVLANGHLYWISVGDSPLFLFDGENLRQINEDHSLAPQIDMMVKSGMLDPEAGRQHPDRNCLTSVLMGTDIPKIDCDKPPVKLQPGNIVIVSSDGLQFLSDDQIQDIVKTHRHAKSSELVDALMQAVEDLDDPDQDNISFAVIKVK